MSIVRKISTAEQKLDGILISTGWTKEQIKTWLDANITYEGMTFDQIREGIDKTASEFPDGFIAAIIQYYSHEFEIINGGKNGRANQLNID